MMRTFFYIILLTLFLVPTGGMGANAEVGNKQDFPDLLEEESSFKTDLPDLLDDDYVFDDDDLLSENETGFGSDNFDVYDPLEPMNRVFFVFNDKLYFWVLKPVKSAYTEVLPWDIRYCIGNFFTNLAAPVRFVNNLLQGEIEDAGIVAARFAINTFLGVAGLGDPAFRDFDIEPRGADFGQTLGKWGIGEGVYLFWPGLGPSNLRDTAGMFGDTYLHPVQYTNLDVLDKAGLYTFDKVNVLSLSPEVYEELKRISLDPYVASREAFYEYRRSIIDKK